MEEGERTWQNLLKNKNFWLVVASVVALLLAVIGVLIIWNIKEDQRVDAEALVIKENLAIPFGADVKVSDFVIPNEKTILEDYQIDTEKVGTAEVIFNYTNARKKRRTRSFSVEITDEITPTIYGQSAYTLPLGYQGDLTDLMLSGDDVDDHPRREVIGDYDINKVGSYELKYQVTDQSGNQTTKDFTLHIVKPSNQADDDPFEATKLKFSQIAKDYKTTKNKIGIDVSQWQGEIDWAMVKAAGVEFAMIRVGYQKGYNGEYILDPYFQQNIEGALQNNLITGVYFYSYANNVAEAGKQAEWVYDQIKDYQLELGAAFDWEDWGNFNNADMSFYTINKVANTFLDTLAEHGYKGMLYGSKVYLERIWRPGKYPVWLAQYYDRATYDGEYLMWQMSSSGQVPGIDGDVDIDILYLK